MNDYEFRPNGSHGVTARRWVARLIDWVLVLVPTSLLWILSVHFLELQLVERTTDLPVAAVDALLREGWTGVQGEVVAAADEFRQTLAGIVVVTLLVQLLAVAIYDWACHGFFARTLGKALLGLTVRAWDPGAPGRAPGRLDAWAALARTSLAVVVPGMGWVLLVAAPISGELVLLVPGVVLVLASVVESAVLRRSPIGRRCGHDRWSGSVVVPVNWQRHAERLGAASQRSRAAAGHAVERARQVQAPRRAIGYATSVAARTWTDPRVGKVRDRARVITERLGDAAGEWSGTDSGRPRARSSEATHEEPRRTDDGRQQ